MTQCCLIFSTMPSDIVGDPMEPQCFFDAVNIILYLQVAIAIHNSLNCSFYFHTSINFQINYKSQLMVSILITI